MFYQILINPNPSADDLAKIALMTENGENVRIDPVIAMVSFLTLVHLTKVPIKLVGSRVFA
jgi:phosphotransacetylase